MTNSNITDELFWDKKYKRTRLRYYTADPIYGKNGLLAKTLSPWLQSGKTILELGCGSSRFMMFFKKMAGLETYGIDFSAEGLAALKQMAASQKMNHNLFLGDMFDHDIDNQKFDIVFHSGLVEHFSDLGLFFKRCHFFCKKDGLMIFFMPNMQNKAWSWHKKICPENYKSHIRYNKNQIIKSLSKDFCLIEARPWGYPQLYAGGPPESVAAMIAKFLYYVIIVLISICSNNYKGNVNEKWSSSWLFICKPQQENSQHEST